MDLDMILQVLGAVFTMQNMALLAFGTLIGSVVAAIPGLTGSMAIAVMLPVTFKLPLIPSLCLLVGTYKASQFGGAISSILIGIPGAPEAAATLLDGFPLAKKGNPRKAVEMGLYASVLAEVQTTFIVITITGFIATLALSFGPAEKFALIFFALMLTSVIATEEPLKGLIGMALGLFMATIGMDPVAGSLRYTFGVQELIDGLSLIPVMIGLFAVPLIIEEARNRKQVLDKKSVIQMTKSAEDRVSWKELKHCLGAIVQGSFIGAFIGATPALGSGPAAFLSYGLAKSRSKNPENYGKGELRGIAAAESGNSGSVGATFIPMLTLGIPGSGIAALFMAALLIQGVNPGPTLFVDNPNIVYSIYAILLIGCLMNLIINYYLVIPAATKIVGIKPSILFPIVTLLCIFGCYGVSNQLFDIFVMLIIGVLAYLLESVHVPVATIVISYVLGGLAEQSLRQSLAIFNNNILLFATKPLALVMLLMSVVVLCYSIRGIIKRKPSMTKGE